MYGFREVPKKNSRGYIDVGRVVSAGNMHAATQASVTSSEQKYFFRIPARGFAGSNVAAYGRPNSRVRIGPLALTNGFPCAHSRRLANWSSATSSANTVSRRDCSVVSGSARCRIQTRFSAP